MKTKTQIDILEDIAINIEKLDEDFILMKEQLIEFKEFDKIIINFKECHVAICPNGGLIAICKKKGFLDITKGTKINTDIIVMHQNAKRKYLIPIDWSYKDKWIINLEFNDKEQLYAICNDGSILKIDILNLRAERKITSELFKNEPIYKCKLFENGFIALTVDGNFYYVNNIKNPTPELIFPMKSLLNFSNNVDFLPISKKYSRTKKLELIITNDKGNGVIHIEKTEDGRFGIKPVEGRPNMLAYKNMHIIKKDKLEIFIKDENRANNNINDTNMGKVVALASSPSKNKIAIYDNRGFIYFFSSDLNFESKVLIRINEEFTENEQNEIKTILSFKDGYQFLFCGEDAVALSGQRFIIIINENEIQNTYKIIEGHEMDAIQGTLFSKCVSEVDGIRYLTNDGIFFITNISKEFYDICNPFSNSPSKKLLKAYLNNLNKLTNSDLSIREIGNFLTNAITSLLVAAANIFWIYDYSTNKDINDKNLSNFEVYNIEKKDLQLFILEAAQYGKNYVKNEDFNFDKFLGTCKDIRIINNLRNHETKPKFITFNEYKNLESEDLIQKVMRILNFGLAFEICRFLDYEEKNIYKKFAFYCIKKMKYNYDTSDELKLFDALQKKLKNCPDLSYILLAKKAFKYNKKQLGLKFLENEKSKLTKIPQYIELKDWDTAIDLASSLYDSNVIQTVFDKLSKRENLNKFLQIASQHPQCRSSVISFLNNNEPELIETFFKNIKNPDELFFYYLEQYFQSPSLSRRKRLLNLAKEVEKTITNSINPNFEHKFYKNYLDSLESNLSFKIDLLNQNKEKFMISKPEETSFDISIYDIYKIGVKEDKYSWIENQNKHFNFSSEGMSIMRFSTLAEKGDMTTMDYLLKKVNQNVKKLGLTNLNLGEIYFKYKVYDKAAENIRLINDSCYLYYKVEMLKIIQRYDLALEAIVLDKNNINMRGMINDILRIKPNLKQFVEELFVKCKINLK